jgi:uncharacterized protein
MTHPVPETGEHDGLSYALFLPEEAVETGVLILHGAGSAKESHDDYGRAAARAGFAAIAFDQRGHGESEGALDARAISDIAAIAGVLRDALGDPRLPVAVRGSSMGGYLAIVAAQSAGAAAVVAICPASGSGLRQGLKSGRLSFPVDADAVDELLAANHVLAAIGELTVPVLLMHAEGDEQVPIEHSRELAKRVQSPASRLVEVPGGHHRSVQHDPELQAISLEFIAAALA